MMLTTTTKAATAMMTTGAILAERTERRERLAMDADMNGWARPYADRIEVLNAELSRRGLLVKCGACEDVDVLVTVPHSGAICDGCIAYHASKEAK